MKNNKTHNKRKNRKLYKRMISLATATIMCCVSMPISEMKDGLTVLSANIHLLTAHAFDSAASNKISIDSFQKLIDYSNNYTNANSNDTLTITFGDSGTSGELTGFKSIGSAAEPFNGKIIIDAGMTLNLPTTMFGGITDDVAIVDTTGAATTLVLTRTQVTQDEPLFADTVVHTRQSGSADWRIHCNRYNNPETSSFYAYDFAGFIGTMKTGANVKFTSLVFDNIGGNGNAKISATGDSGLVCRTMEDGAVLEIDDITQTVGNGTSAYNVESTSSGNAGGLVGSMGNGAKLILGSSLINPQGNGQNITATSGYAGGIVGYCNGGTIKFNNAAPYAPNQVINGSNGAGGIAGYYNTTSTEAATEEYNRYAISTGNISITSNCKVNGGGHCGGLFGELINDGDMTVSGSTAVSPDHSGGAASSYGALIGNYTAAALSDSIVIGTTGTNAPERTGGSVAQFGGLIGLVSASSYVKFRGVSVNVSNATATVNFGGFVGRAQEGFIELTGTNMISYAYPSTTKTFAGVVGDLKDGVLYLQGTTDLSGAPAVSTAAASSGQVVGYRDYGLVFAADGWTMTRPNASQTLDDVGSWGEVVRFDATKLKQSDVLTINDTSGEEHYVTLKPAVVTMSNTTDFVKTALNIQLNKEQSSGVLRCDSASKSSTLLAKDLELSGSSTEIDLSGTGITGITRDSGSNCVQFTGSFDGKGGKIKLAIGEEYCTNTTGEKTEGNGKIYRHTYNGLFANTSGAEIKNLNISEDSTINIKALKEMYIGNVVAQATGDLTLDTVAICSDTTSSPEKYATIKNAGSDSCIGGLVGNLTGADTVSITGCSYNGKIEGEATSSQIGGLIGMVSGSNTFGITIDNSTVDGKIEAVSGNEVGGTVGVITSTGNTTSYPSTGRTLALNGLTVSGLEMKVDGESGGFLGHKWYETDVDFTNFTVSGSASLAGNESDLGDTAGLVHTATGYWKVKTGGINLSSMSITANAATSFGLLVNKGYHKHADETWGASGNTKSSAIYLELAPGAYTVTKNGVGLTMGSVTTFDEIVAYTGTGDLASNGQGVVSIATTDHALLGMDNANAGATYVHQTAFLDTNASLRDNPNTRYYYNLDAYREALSDDKQKLLIWSVKQYAQDSIKNYFDKNNTINGSVGSSASTSLDMSGYSYYPVDLTGTLTLKGAVHLYNTEFDTTEKSATDSRKTTESGQHYLMQNSLFRNVSGTLNANITLNGNVNKIENYCGALVMGTVESNASGSPATINVNSLELAGVKIGSAAGPLLINKAGSNATLNITNVSNDSTSYANMGAGAGATEDPDTHEYSYNPTYIATSLLGNIGSANDTAVKLTFSQIKLDGRNSAGVTNLSSLNDVYHSKGSLFSNAPLVEKLAYKTDSGSYGVYNFEYDKDWGVNADRNVTYGAEINNTVENRDDDNSSKQTKYNKLSANDTEYFIRPDANPALNNNNSIYTNFGTYFQNYVYTPYTSGGTNHELRVNISTKSFSGCGTYNDPYIITGGSDLENIAKIINNNFTDSAFTIRVPSDTSETWCNNKTEHITYNSFDHTSTDNTQWVWSTGGDNPQTILNNNLREYLAGAYYKIDPNLKENIKLTTFEGISNNVSVEYAFRGVIDGSNQTIENQTTNPLIVNSYGSVIYNLNIEVNPDSPLLLSQNAAKTFQTSGTKATERCEAYGAVIGQIFGGDNIIDDVSVKFTGAVINANTGTAKKAHLVPIGGYVGVVINGGLIFRNMTGLAQNNEAGIKSANLTGFGTGVGDNPSDPTAADNTKWLYVNPIIGRVMNGYAFTESDTYKPFEDGSRTYPGGTEYWHGTSANTVGSGKVGVTMRNGTKNYSIPDIKSNITSTFGMTGVTDGSDITVHNAQELYIISLITQSGLGKSASGAYTQGAYLKPYDDYMSTHLSDYHYVGSADLPATEPTALIADATSNTQKASNDYYIAKSSDKYSGSGTDKVPYLMEHYTPKVNNAYPAFAVAGSADAYYDLIFDENGNYDLPDSYRGLGSLMFGVKDPTCTGNNLDNFKDNVVFLSGLNGNGNEVSMNMKMLGYADDNYQILIKTGNDPQTEFKTGFSLINCLQSNGTLQNITLKGSVKSELIGTDGNCPGYSNNYVGKTGLSNPAVAAFVGVPVSGSGSITFNNIKVDGMELSGMCYAGGFVGVLNIAETLTFTGCQADDLSVFAGGAAGGLIGYLRNNNAKIYADFGVVENGTTKQGTFGIKSVISASQNDSFGTNGAPAAGGLIGYRKTGVSSNINDKENFTIKNVRIKNGTSVPNGGYIGYNKDGASPNTDKIPAGGVVGQGDVSTILNCDNVTIENLNISGAKAGGIAGVLQGTNSYATIQNCMVLTDTSTKCSIRNSAALNGVAGGFIGYNATPKGVKITDSVLTGYVIEGAANISGMIGHNNSDSAVTATNIELNSYTIKGNDKIGGLVGYQQNGELDGYNILLKDQTSKPFTEGTTITDNGYIIGNNADKVIKLVGFSRQGTIINTAKMVGNSTAPSSENYGDGYVIFADYKDTASTDKNDKYANLLTKSVNVGEGTDAAGSKTTITDYEVVAQRGGNSSTVKNESANEAPSSYSDEILYKTDGITPLGKGETQESYSAATKYWKYVENEYATTLAELYSTRISNGFYLYIGGSEKKWAKNIYDGGDAIVMSTSFDDAAAWHIVRVGSTGDQYKLYMTDTSGVNQYIKADTTGSDNLYITSDPNEAQILTANLGEDQDSHAVAFTFCKTVKNKNYYLGFRGKKGGLAYQTTAGEKHTYIQLKYVYQPDAVIKSTQYSTITYNGTAITCSGEGETTNATAAQIEQYGSLLTDSTYEVYVFTKTQSENVYVPTVGARPFVTTNPKTLLTDTQWLTGDGVSFTSFYGSAAQDIIKDISNAIPQNPSPSNKRYQCAELKKTTGQNIVSITAAEFRTQLTSSMKSIKAVIRSDDAYNGKDFPVLVIDDLSTANDTVNNYLRLLTNTNYDFSHGYSNGETYTGDYKQIFNVDISKWKYNSGSGEFEKQNAAASLKCIVNDRFYITPTEVDNENWQISLIDVQFYDPTHTPTFNAQNQMTSAGLVAHHLYVPVIVKKMLHYTVQIRPASTTTYKLDAYPNSVANLLENLGNPITMKVTYTYQQTAKNWEDAINNGESVYRNYNKILDVKAWNDRFPNNAIAVLVDPNDNIDKYYSANLSSVLTDGEVIDAGTKTYKLKLESFSGFDVPKLNDLMTITLNNEAETRNLVEWVRGTDADSEIVAVIKDGKTTTENGETTKQDLYLRYKKGTETGLYAVSVELKNYQNNTDYVQENYYISIFTKEDPNKNNSETMDKNIYHYTVSSTGTSFGDSSYPSARIGDETPHLFMGNLYENNVDINETNNNRLMSGSNLSLSADLTANVGFTENAVASLIQNYIDNENVKIYQTFLVALNRLNGADKANQRGILVDPVVVPSNYKFVEEENGAQVKKDPSVYGLTYSLDYSSSGSYIELTNECNLRKRLQYAAQNPKTKTKTVNGETVTVNDYTISITESIAMTYTIATLSAQFPQATAQSAVNSENSTVGTYMIGYSNISSTSDGGAASRASVNTDGSTRLCYYIADDTSVEFSYNAVANDAFEDDGNGNYGQLGLDGKELDENNQSFVQIKSAAYYNTYDYNQKTSGHYVKLTVKLAKKGDDNGGNDDYETALDIPTYLSDFEILDKDGNEIIQTADNPSTLDINESVTVIKNSADHIYTYIIPKDQLEQLSPDVYYIPINFKAYSGKNNDFETKANTNMEYSNYKVLVTVGLLEHNSITEAPLNNSGDYDHIIYTNAKIHSEIIE